MVRSIEFVRTAVWSSGWELRRECCYVIKETLSNVFFSFLFIGERKRSPSLLHPKFEKEKSFFIGLGAGTLHLLEGVILGNIVPLGYPV